ncbi:PREDICTED: tRNA pseudouridine(38/39) synthase-like isoform X1 [Lupinus angustifolius]|uniref:tRNA pseudouridine(38/39) synthase-like isoform X1 n=1 Tax=Lupinus angustifolius TaxID=3871 RepID=UPI00092E603E|nr:PREDICTED: tRNA pseudouridine(38/39) synthase-like isoform X1 [Lupinus angustifolius]
MATELNGVDNNDLKLIATLQARVKELEAENAKLLSLLADCHSHEMEKKSHSPGEKGMKSKKANKKSEKKIEKMPGYCTKFMSHHSKRYVALKVMYFGKRFYGFASEAQMEPTIESEIFKALEKTRLLVGDRKQSQYSRCGRTDKGVSSVGQVIALFLRSNLKISGANSGSSGQIILDEQHEGEIDYVRVLNQVLPNDIRILGWCPVPVDFHARFSCLSREYKYFFWKENLNILAMESAGKKLLGEHDFRNLCKMDAANVHNYRRRITSFEISPTDVRYDGNQLCVIKIRGSAFLWHQVRCMVAVLFMVGKDLESPSVIDMLLDTEKIPRKPQFIMASEVPLVLQSCEFEDIKFMCSSDAGQALRLHLANECQAYQLQAAIFDEALLNCVPLSDDQSSLPIRETKKKASHVPLMSRSTEPSYEERRAKFNSNT